MSGVFKRGMISILGRESTKHVVFRLRVGLESTCKAMRLCDSPCQRTEHADSLHKEKRRV
jgi:hypothetical protein